MANSGFYIGFIVVYFLVMIGVGWLSRRFARSADGFFVAGRKGTTLFITGSLVATIIGGSATVVLGGMGFRQGLTAIWLLLVGSIGLIILGIFLAKKLRSTSVYTLPELAEQQYNSKVSIVSSILIVVAWLGIIAVQIGAAGTIMDALVGHKTAWMIAFTGVFVCYTLIGGQHANIRTDIIQACIIFGGILAAIIIVMINVGGWSGLQAALPADHFSFPLSSQFGGVNLVSFLLLVGLTYVIGPDMYSRLFCAKNEKVARKSVLWAAVLIIPFAFCIVLLGMSAAALYPGIESGTAFPALIQDQLPLFFGGLVLAAIIGATMSSSDSILVNTGTIMSVDIIKKMKPDLSEKKTILIARISIVVIGVLSLLLALYFNNLISTLLFAYTVYTGGVVIPVFAGFYREKLKLTPIGAIAAIVGGGTAAVISKLLEVKYLDLGALAISAALLFIVSYVDRKYIAK